ncbi:DUF4398 domain-containing protein [Rhodanobacter sp. PCA2]|uniref:DUF4398 domain-containing protein n=1 Tax=Rhodanobacter sp. PCA2 TaxID=2006117 RepID=UPI0021067BBC|nr:DUF4398 domain-containing protein [Rhodanobacter sp. PCA2]MBA2077419.1 hypothetical protein [Rhodanobacter sp. PCA2]
MVHISPSSPRYPARLRGPGRQVALAGVLAGLLVLAGCASVPPPNDSMNLAQTQLQAARDAGAADYDPVDLGFAQDKFQQAQGAMAARKYELAADLAAESRADAELARVKANLGAARAKIQSKMNANAELREQGAQAAAAAAAEFAKPLPLPATAGSAPPPAGAGALPPAAPLEDMPAPSDSELAPPPSSSGQGFQSVPAQNPPSRDQDSNAGQGFQPAGGQP